MNVSTTPNLVQTNIPQNISNVGNVTVTNHYDSLLTVEGNVDRDALPGLQDILEKSYKYTTNQMQKRCSKTRMESIKITNFYGEGTVKGALLFL